MSSLKSRADELNKNYGHQRAIPDDALLEAHSVLDFSVSNGFIDFMVPVSKLANRELKPREWVLDQWIPKGEPSMTGGPPGAGKSLLSQAISTAVSYRNHVYGIEANPCPTLYLTCEDDMDELHRRQLGICRMLEFDIALLTNQYLVSFKGQDARLATKSGDQFMPTSRYYELDQMMGDYKLGLVHLDLVPDFFDGNENIRNDVNRFVKGTLGSLAARHNCAVNFLYHPSRSGLADGSGLSGSTAWEGSVRSRLYLTGEDENGIRTLSRKKSNYSGQDDGFNLEWRDEALWPSERVRIERKSKPLGRYAQVALDALRAMGGIVPVSVDQWRERFLEQYQGRYGEPPSDIPGAWRDSRKQLHSRSLIQEEKGRVWLAPDSEP